MGDVKAVAWFRKAADQGLATAEGALGEMYANGRGVPRDDVQAATWYRKAADHGLASSKAALGEMYANGRGVPRDIKQAVTWYRKAAEQGHSQARSRLEELEVLERASLNDNDIVAKVLNYTAFGKDEGTDGAFWYKEAQKGCRYRLYEPRGNPKSLESTFKSLESKLNNLYGIKAKQSIDLEDSDPKNITFVLESGETVVRHVNDVLIKGPDTLDGERLHRGWSLIYSKFCRGKEMPF